MNKIAIFILLFALAFPLSCIAQDIEQKPKAENVKQKESAYISKNFEECFAGLKKILTPQQLEEFGNKKEEDVIEHYLSLGI